MRPEEIEARKMRPEELEAKKMRPVKSEAKKMRPEKSEANKMRPKKIEAMCICEAQLHYNRIKNQFYHQIPSKLNFGFFLLHLVKSYIMLELRMVKYVINK